MGLNLNDHDTSAARSAELAIDGAAPLVMWTDPKAAKRITVTEGSHRHNLTFPRDWEKAASDGWEHRIAVHRPEPELGGPLTEAEWFLDHVAHVLAEGDAAGIVVPNGDVSPWVARWVEVVRARLAPTITVVLL